VALVGRGRGEVPAVLATAERMLRWVTVIDVVFDRLDVSP
jgi:hypothetical protein